MTELEAYKAIIDSSFHVSLNMNDTFDYSCADAEELDTDDIKHVVPIAMKYGVSETLLAYASIKRGYESIITNFLTEKYQAAKKELQLLADTGAILFEEHYNRQQAEQDKKDFGGQVIEWDNSKLVKRKTVYRLQRFLQDHYDGGSSYCLPHVAKLPDGTFAVGLSYNAARNRLLRKYNNQPRIKRLKFQTKQTLLKKTDSIANMLERFLTKISVRLYNRLRRRA